MDLGYIITNCSKVGGYASTAVWMADVRQIETNARLYHRVSVCPKLTPI
jgi:hypothetical protein